VKERQKNNGIAVQVKKSARLMPNKAGAPNA